jgi:hypothetical protein
MSESGVLAAEEDEGLDQRFFCFVSAGVQKETFT